MTINKFENQESKETSKAIYNSCKRMVAFVGGSMDRLKGDARKHIIGYMQFIDGHEAGIYESWKQFFKCTKEDYAIKDKNEE